MDTIVGLSTALSNSAVNIIRISGNEALFIIEKIFTNNKTQIKPNEIRYGFIKYQGKIYDEVLVSFMKAPKSYTGEDVIEINCHGGVFLTNEILNLLLDLGCKLAEPGEFTKRAFLNGKIDLTKAESIIDLINAKSQIELDCAINNKMGNLFNKLDFMKSKIINITAQIEAIVDFEDEIEDIYSNNILTQLEEIRIDIINILKYKDEGRLIKDGISTCIIGKPNVGKSSLMNYLCKYKKAIVTDVEGTTRDIIEEIINLEGIILRLYDTAGIRESNDIVESIGIDKAKNKINESDLILFLLDYKRGIDENDINIYDLIRDKNTIFVVNKCDYNENIKNDTIKDIFNIKNDISVSNISIKNELGFKNLRNIIKSKFLSEELNSLDNIILTNSRHIEAFLNMEKSLNDAIMALKNDIPLDIVSIDIRKCIDYIKNITGEDLNEEVINNIFSRFCIGK